MGKVQGRNGGGSGSSAATRWILLAAFMNVAIIGTVMGLRNSLWFDEAATIFTTSGGPLDAFHRALRFEQQPPLYFLLAWLWRQLHPSVEFLRLLSGLCISGTIFLLWRMSEDLRLGSRWWSLALLGALTPHVLWAASEARVYALTLLLVTASTWLFFRLMDEARGPRAADLLAYVAVSYLGLLTFYYVGFVLLGHAIAGLLSQRRRALLGAQVVIGVLLLPWMPAILQQFGGRQQYLPPLEWAAAPFGAAWLWQLVQWCGGIVTTAVFRAAPFLHSTAGTALLLATLALITACRFLPGARRIPVSEWRLVVAGGVPVLILMGLRVSNLSLVMGMAASGVASSVVLLSGIAVAAPLLHLPIDDLRRQLEINVIGQVIVTQAFAPLLGTDRSLQGSPGRIVNMSSVAGKMAMPFVAPYAMSKHALEALSESLRRELLLYGIDVIIIGPGAIVTPIWDKANEMDVAPYERTEYGKVINKFRDFMISRGKAGLPASALPSRQRRRGLRLEKWTKISSFRTICREIPSLYINYVV